MRFRAFYEDLPALDEVLDIVASADDGVFEYKEVTITDFKNAHSSLKKYSARQLGEALTAVGIVGPQSSTRVNGKCGRYRLLPMHKR